MMRFCVAIQHTRDAAGWKKPYVLLRALLLWLAFHNVSILSCIVFLLLMNSVGDAWQPLFLGKKGASRLNYARHA